MIGLQIYTVRDKMTDADSAAETAKAIKEIGYECVQLAGDAATLRRDAEACHAMGLNVVGILTNPELLAKERDEFFALAKEIGASDIGISSHMKTEEEARALVILANSLARAAHDAGFTFSYHNHSNEFINTESGETLMDIIVSGFDPEYIDFMPDTYWLQHGGADVRAFLERVDGRVKIMHLKDMKRAVSGPTFAPVGDGNMNFEGIVATAKAIGAIHYVVEQDVCEGDSLECAKRSYEYVKNLI